MARCLTYPLPVGRAGVRRAGPARPLLAFRTLLAALLLVVVLTGCRADVAVEVAADAGGDGHVRATLTLDEEAADQVPDLADQLRVDDLEAAGWVIEGPTAGPGAATTLRATRPFASPAGAGRALDELGGTAGPFTSLQVTRERTFWKTRTFLAGSVDLTAGLDVFSDQALAERLGGPGLGMDPAALERELGRPLAEVFTFEVAARLPGEVESNAPANRGEAAVWPAALGQTVQITASSEAWNVVNIALAIVSVLAAVALAVIMIRRSRAVSWS